MSKRQPVILRCTISVDMDESKMDRTFVKSMLRRLNVLHATTKPAKALVEILGVNKIRDMLSVTQSYVPAIVLPAKVEQQLPLPTQSIQQPTKPKEKVTYKLIALKERRMPLPKFVELEYKKGIDTQV